MPLYYGDAKVITAQNNKKFNYILFHKNAIRVITYYKCIFHLNFPFGAMKPTQARLTSPPNFFPKFSQTPSGKSRKKPEKWGQKRKLDQKKRAYRSLRKSLILLTILWCARPDSNRHGALPPRPKSCKSLILNDFFKTKDPQPRTKRLI